MNALDHIEDGPFFVWIKGLRGPIGQKWATMSLGDASKQWQSTNVLVAHKIFQSEFDHVPLADLAKRYPPPSAALIELILERMDQAA